MANHGYLKTDKTLNSNEVERVAKEVIEKYNLTSLEFTRGKSWQSENEWFLRVDNYNAVNFWIADELEYGFLKEGEWIEYAEPQVIKANSVIEFRHGHGLDIMWWMEKLFMYHFQEAFGGQHYDDGLGDEPYEIKPPTTYKEYKKGKTSSVILAWLKEQTEMLPPQLKKDLNL